MVKKYFMLCKKQKKDFFFFFLSPKILPFKKNKYTKNFFLYT